MDIDLKIQPLFSGGATITGRFHNFTGLKFMSGGESTPGHTPTTLAMRLSRTRPQVYKAIEEPSNKRVAIKAVHHTERSLLENEWVALRKLNTLNFWLPWLKIAPSLREDLRFFKKKDGIDGIWFIACEWLDTDGNWEQLSKIVTEHPLKDMPDAAVHMKKLRNTLVFYTHLMHLLGISHGDNKDEHIFVYKKDGSYFFDNIRIIDFGTCYLHSGEDWKGGSVGFSRPRFWNESYRSRLSIRELRGLDWYGLYATLYYAYTGECFPTASPAYSKLSGELEYHHLHELKPRVQAKWKGHADGTVQELIDEANEKLCSPDSLGESNTAKFLLEPLSRMFTADYQFLLVYGVLALGCWDINIFAKGIHHAFLIGFLLINLFILRNKEDLTHQQYKLSFAPLLIYIAFITMISNLGLLSFLLPFFLVSFVILSVFWATRQKGSFDYLFAISILGPIILSSPASSPLLLITQSMLMPHDKKYCNWATLLVANFFSTILLGIWLLLTENHFIASKLLPLALIWMVFGQIIYWLNQNLTLSKRIVLIIFVLINLMISSVFWDFDGKMFSADIFFFILIQILRTIFI